MEWKKTLMVTGGVAAIIGAALTVPIVSSNSRSNKTRESRSSAIVSREVSSLKGTDLGIVYVSNVQELQNAIRTASDFETIVVTKKGSPYVLSELPCMNTNGYLYVTNSITIRGETGNPNEVVIGGEYEYYDENITNRIFYIKAQGCKIDGLSIRNGNCTTNEYHKYGGGVYRGGAIYLALATNECLISNCNFNMNGAINGGAIACSKKDDETTIIKNCRFYQNYAIGNGGAIYNGGIIDHCNFTYNIAYKSGGAVCYGNVLWSSGDTYNQASSNKGSELYGCTAIGYEYAGGDGMVPGSSPMSRFHDCILDRCRLCVTNGLLFSGWYDIRSTLIANGRDFSLSVASPTIREESSVRGEDYPSSLVNCTIVSNINYSLLAKGKIGTSALSIYNTIFSENTTHIVGGIFVNKNLATNGYYKTVEYTRGQQYVALGWNGDYNTEFWAGNDPSFDSNLKVQPSDYGLMSFDDTYKSLYVRTDSGYNDYTIEVSLSQYLHVFGWNGDTTLTNFTAKLPTAKSVKSDTYGLHLSLAKEASTNLTWFAYYESLGWHGVGDYTEDAIVKCDFSRDISPVFRTVAGTFFSIPESEYSENWWESEYWVWNSCPLCPDWQQQYVNEALFENNNPQEPYSISQYSPAYHSYKWEVLPENMRPIAVEFPWMETSTDLAGRPRLSGGGLDIGAYQAGEYRKPTKFIIRIR